MHRFRHTTPAEEYNRTWVQKASKLDVSFYLKKIEQYNDPDGDEHLVKEHFLKRNLRRKELKLLKDQSK